MIILHNSKKGNNYIVAKILAKNFNCKTATPEDCPRLSKFNTIIIVVSNTGDEELPQPMEDYLAKLKIKNKKYIVCELGNYFGFENYSGCKKIVFKILNDLGWEKISDISLDSVPSLDKRSLKKWLSTLNKNDKNKHNNASVERRKIYQ